MKKKTICLIAALLAISLVLLLAGVSIYKIGNLPVVGNRVIQNIVYTLLLLNTVLFMKLSKKPVGAFGLFRAHPVKQLVTGLIIAAACFLFAALIGWRPYRKEDLLYLAASQLLVAFSEELLFRGVLLALVKDLVNTSNRAVLVTAVIFGAFHFPIGQSLGQVVGTFIIGAVFGTIRIVFEDTDDEVGVLSLTVVHWAWNVFL